MGQEAKNREDLTDWERVKKMSNEARMPKTWAFSRHFPEV
jgi:hypothetical protein